MPRLWILAIVSSPLLLGANACRGGGSGDSDGDSGGDPDGDSGGDSDSDSDSDGDADGESEGATRFLSSPLIWSTLEGGIGGSAAPVGFYLVSGGDWYGGNSFWTTMDMTGDGRPDLVVTSLEGVQLGDPGSRSWQVFPGAP